MGQKRLVEVVDDLTGYIIDDYVTVQWGVAGELLEFDTSPESAAVFLGMLAPYRSASRRIPPTRPGLPASASARPTATSDLRAVRQWAQSVGYPVGRRGRIPRPIVDHYRQAVEAG